MIFLSPQIIFSILIHVFVIALLEVLFYFFYVTKMEEKALTDAVSGMVNNVSNQVDLDLIKKLVNNKNFNDINLNNIKINNYIDQSKIENFQSKLNNIDRNSRNKKKSRNERQNNLLKKSLFLVVLLLIATIAVYVLNKKKIKLGYVLKETLGVLVLMGIFEYLFFTKIILKNPTISNS
jgi:ATP-dependent Zn protease